MLLVGVNGALAATGSLSCVSEGGMVECSGASWSNSTTVELNPNSAASCNDSADFQFSCITDGSGNLPADCHSASLEFGTWYVYGTEDSCSTSTAASTNPQAHAGNAYLANSTSSFGSSFADIQAFLLTHVMGLAVALAVVGGVVVLIGMALRKLAIRRNVRRL